MCSFLFKFSVQWLNQFIDLIELDCDKKKCEDTKGVTRRRKSMTDRQEKRETKTNTDSQNTTQHRKLRITQHEHYKTRVLNIQFKTMNSSITRRIVLTKNNESHTHRGG